MVAITYERATQSLASTIRALTEEVRGQLDEDSQTHCDMANGAVRAWRDMFGADVRAEDEAHRRRQTCTTSEGSSVQAVRRLLDAVWEYGG